MPEEVCPHEASAKVEMVRLHALPDLWLAAALLRLARDARRALGDRAANPLRDDPITDFLWQIVPEVARRLGAAKALLANESSRMGLRECNPDDLRRAVGSCLSGGAGSLSRETTPLSAMLLWRDPGHGSPCVIGLDRIAPPPPPHPLSDDWVAARVAAAARAAGHDQTTSWEPGLALLPPRPVASVLRPRFGREPEMPDPDRPGMGRR